MCIVARFQNIAERVVKHPGCGGVPSWDYRSQNTDWWPGFNPAPTVFVWHGMWPLLERGSKTAPLHLRSVVFCLLLVHSVDVNQHGFCTLVRVSKTSLISSAYEALHLCCLVSHWIPNHPVVAKDWNLACHCSGWRQTDFTLGSQQNLLEVLRTTH